RLLMLMEILLGHRERVRERGADALAEPGLDAEAEEQVGEDRDDDGRDHRHEAEEHDEPHVKARAGEAAPPLGPHLDDAPGDNGAKRQHQYQIEQQEELIHVGPAAAEGRQTAERRVCPGGGGQRRERERDRRLADQPYPPRPEHQPPRYAHPPPSPAPSRPKPRGCYFKLRATSMSNARIFLRSVLRFNPRSCAALSWLPRVAPKVSMMRGRSTSRSTRS